MAAGLPIMTIDGKLLEILCCPVSKTPLIRLSGNQLEALNVAIRAREIQTIQGDVLEQELDEALITEDLKVMYPVIDNIPILLEEKGIGTTQL